LNEDGVTACRESTILIQFKKNTPKNSFYHSTNKEHPLPNNSTNNPNVGLPLVDVLCLRNRLFFWEIGFFLLFFLGNRLILLCFGNRLTR
jgi:hypothetical protein